MARSVDPTAADAGKINQVGRTGSGQADPITTAVGQAGQGVATAAVATGTFVAKHPVDAGIAVAGAVLTCIPATSAIGVGLDITAGIAISRDIVNDANKPAATTSRPAQATEQAGGSAGRPVATTPSVPVPPVQTGGPAKSPLPAGATKRDWVTAFLFK